MPCSLQHLLYLGGRHITRENATYPPALDVNLQHDLGSSFAVFIEVLLQDENDEFHGREIVVQQYNLEHLGRLDALRLAFEHDGITATGNRGFEIGLFGFGSHDF